MNRTAVALLYVILSLIGSGVAAQPVSPWLRPDHWSARALVQLHAAGLTPAGFDAARRERTAAEAGAVLRHAWRTAARALLPIADTTADTVAHARALGHVDAYVRRFADDRPAAFARTFELSRQRSYWHIEGGAGVVDRAGALLAGGFTLDRVWQPPRAVPDFTAPAVHVDAAAVWRGALALTVQATRAGHAGRIERATIDARIGSHVSAWAGRRAAAYAGTRAGGLVLHGDVAYEGGGVRLTQPLRIPVIGASTAELSIGRLDPNGQIVRPWLWLTRLHAQPHARFDIGGTRAAVFGATGDASLGVKQIVEVLVAANLSGAYADDQVASLDARWRPPLGALPLQLYGEWGVHDIDAQVFFDVPAFALGARAPALPFAPLLGVALEHTQISRSCCRNPPWYHHFELADGWTEDGVLLGHPLGGHGREWRAVVDGAFYDARVLLELQSFRRVRGAENLFAPTRAGRSVGAQLRLDARAAARVIVTLKGSLEEAARWTERDLSVLVHVRL